MAEVWTQGDEVKASLRSTKDESRLLTINQQIQRYHNAVCVKKDASILAQ